MERYLFVLGTIINGDNLSVVDEVLRYIATNEIKWVDLHFFDVTGFLHRTTISNKDVEETIFDKGIHPADLYHVFGASEQGELLLVPDPDTMARVPWEPSTIRFICDIKSAEKNERFLKDSRYAVERIESNIQAIGAKTASVGCQVDFHIFDSASTDRTTPGRGAGTLMDSRESKWNPSNLAGFEKGAYVAHPFDSMYGARSQISETLEENFGVVVDGHRHGRSKTAQQTISIKESSIKNAADSLISLKFVVRNLSNAVGASSTFMPYPVEGEFGSSLEISQSIWKTAEKNVFYDSEDVYAQLSQSGRYYIGGILEHLESLTFLTNPTVNSYKRLAADPKSGGWSKDDRAAAVQVPTAKRNYKEAKRIVYTLADPSVNPYLAYAAVVAAGLDGIKNKIEAGDPTESDSKKKKIKDVPSSLLKSIEAVASDSKFIKGAIPKEIIEQLVDIKYEEYKRGQMAVSSWELDKFFNV